MLDVIAKRRSCRSYSDTPVEEYKIKEIVNAGLNAPSGMNRQTPVILAISNKEIRDKLSKINCSIMNRGEMDPFYNAPVILLVMANKNGLSVHDGAASIENMLLEATHQGLACCWIHRAEEELKNEEFRSLFSFLEINFDDYIGIGHVIVGYPSKDATVRDKVINDNRAFYI